MATLDKKVAAGIAEVSLWSSRNAKVVVLLTLVATIGLGYGVTQITTNVDVADVLPRGNHNTEAAHNLTDKFKSTFTQQVTFQLHVTDDLTYQENNAKLPQRMTEANGQNITDEVYVRAMQELTEFIQAETDFDRTISIAGVYQLVNWTAAGGQNGAPEESYAIPGTTPDQEFLYRAVDEAIKRSSVLEAVDTLSSPSWNHAAMLFMPPADNQEDMRVLGESIIQARDDYVAAVERGETTWSVWGEDNPPLLTVDLPVANAHSSALVEQDMLRLMPMIAAFIIACLFIAFRNIRSIVISFTALGVGVVWTYGTMGYMGIALNTLNMTIVPLIMGVGIDYAIHMINEFLEHKAEGRSDAEAFQKAGDRAGLAMLIATLTTVLGLIVMMISPSLLMAQLGFLSAVAIAAIYVLTITFIPAALTLMGGTDKMGNSFNPSTTMPALARGVTKVRFLMILIVLGLTGGAYVSSQGLEEEAFGDPGKNFPADDPIRQEHEQGLEWFYEIENPDVKANILTFQGPRILTPDAIQYMRTIEANLATKERVIPDTLRTLMFFVETWQLVKGGPGCLVPPLVLDSAGGAPGPLDPLLGAGADTGAPCADQIEFPSTEAELRSEIQQMFESPMRELAAIIVNYPQNDIVAMTMSVRAFTFDEAVDVWDQVWSAVDAANQEFDGRPPEGVQVSFVGNTATNYLFVEEQLPWLTYMSIAATIILFILVFAFTRNIKTTIIATFLAGITSLWWLGALPFINIGLAITLMLPLVFIFNIGTDYVVHIMWNIRQVGDTREVFGTVGKAILFSAITTAGAFAFFIGIQNVAVSRTMIATTLSIFIIFMATMMVIPSFYPVQPKGARPGETKKPARKREREPEPEPALVAVKRRKA